MKPNKDDKLYYCVLFRDYPSLSLVSRVKRDAIPKQALDSYDLALRICRIGPVADCWIKRKDWDTVVRDLGLRSSIPPAVIRRIKRDDALVGMANLISSAYDSPYPASVNPCPRITFRRPKVRG